MHPPHLPQPPPRDIPLRTPPRMSESRHFRPKAANNAVVRARLAVLLLALGIMRTQNDVFALAAKLDASSELPSALNPGADVGAFPLNSLPHELPAGPSEISNSAAEGAVRHLSRIGAVVPLPLDLADIAVPVPAEGTAPISTDTPIDEGPAIAKLIKRSPQRNNVVTVTVTKPAATGVVVTAAASPSTPTPGAQSSSATTLLPPPQKDASESATTSTANSASASPTDGSATALGTATSTATPQVSATSSPTVTASSMLGSETGTFSNSASATASAVPQSTAASTPATPVASVTPTPVVKNTPAAVPTLVNMRGVLSGGVALAPARSWPVSAAASLILAAAYYFF